MTLARYPVPISQEIWKIFHIFFITFSQYFLILSATDLYTAALNRGDIAGALLIEPLRTFGEREAPSMY